MNHAFKIFLTLALWVLAHQGPAAAAVGGLPNELTAPPQLRAASGQPPIENLKIASGDGVESELGGTTWRLVAIGDRDAIEGVQTVLTFESVDRVSGSGGCNGFFGGVEISGASLDFGMLGATQMACVEAIGDQEYRFFQALEKARSYAMENDVLLIMNGDGNEILRLTRI